MPYLKYSAMYQTCSLIRVSVSHVISMVHEGLTWEHPLLFVGWKDLGSLHPSEQTWKELKGHKWKIKCSRRREMNLGIIALNSSYLNKLQIL